MRALQVRRYLLHHPGRGLAELRPRDVQPQVLLAQVGKKPGFAHLQRTVFICRTKLPIPLITGGQATGSNLRAIGGHYAKGHPLPKTPELPAQHGPHGVVLRRQELLLWRP